MGPDFAKLWTANAVSNIGDGISLAAGPLLIASLTDDPRLVAGGAFVQLLPWLLFSLVSGVFVDRLDRRRLVAVVNVLRAVVIGGLTAAVALDAVGVPVVYVAFFLLGTGETLADNASAALLPSIVPAEGLARANARMFFVHQVGNQLIAPPLGAVLFGIAAALPFGVDAASFVVAAVLVLSLRYRPPAVEAAAQPVRRSVRVEIAEGVRWLWRQRVLRMLALCLCLMNVTLDAGIAILVLYARERLGLDGVGYGVLLASIAVGGMLGSVLARPLMDRFGAAVLLRVGLVIETLTHVGLALARTPWLALVVLVVFGVHGTVWGVVTMTVRQRVIPGPLFGRVTSVFYLFSRSGAALGSLAGGVLAAELGVTAPFWCSAAVMTVVTAVAVPLFTRAELAATTGATDRAAPATTGKA
ncbi:MFS transporter [Goodfellowiella coeruleoviolacea]|uniref:MFS transporter n=1 Tax=Goodfellowiella coeruleoviolacea TaxID=334858 RepID=UPI000AD1301C|nr:MFS transporter [Goodfellowiella coeruleoviolacea]